MVGVVQALLDRVAERLPDLLAAEPVAHQVAGLDHELLALVALLAGQVGVGVLQGHPPEGDVTGLVLHDVAQDLLGQRVGGGVAQQPERGEREALDQHLHAEVGHVPAAVGQRGREQRLQMRVDRVDQLDLFLQEAGVRLGVASLVHGLRARVELRVKIRHALDDAGRADHRALLAVQELAELPRDEVLEHLVLVALAELFESRRAVDRAGLLTQAQRR